MQKIGPILFGLVVAVIIALSCTFVVSPRQHAIVFALGEIKDVKSEPGLYFKLPSPLQNVQFFDKRIITIDSPDAERVQTKEKKNVLVDSYVKWRIADPRLYFVRFQGSERAASDRMSGILRDALNAEINQRTVNDVTSKERDKIMANIRTALAKQMVDLGIEVVDVRLKRVDFVPEINDSVFKRMVSERARAANQQRAEGSAEGEKIKASADQRREEILAKAYAEAQGIKGAGDAEAAAIYAKAFGQDREFFNFYRSMQAYQASLSKKSDVLVVDPSSDFFRYLKNQNGGQAPARK